MATAASLAVEQAWSREPAPGRASARSHRTSARTRLVRAGVSGLRRDEVGEPVGNALNHSLITELLLSTTLVPPGLRLLGDSDDW